MLSQSVCLFVFRSFYNHTIMDEIDVSLLQFYNHTITDEIDVSLLQEKLILPKLLDFVCGDLLYIRFENLLGIFFI